MINYLKSCFLKKIGTSFTLVFFLIFSLNFTFLSVFSLPAHAKKFGSGKSMGRQNSNYSKNSKFNSDRYADSSKSQGQNYNKSNTMDKNYDKNLPQKNGFSWKSMAGGLLAGFGLAALFNHFGLGGLAGGVLGSILNFVLILFGAFLLYKLISRLFAKKPAYEANYDKNADFYEQRNADNFQSYEDNSYAQANSKPYSRTYDSMNHRDSLDTYENKGQFSDANMSSFGKNNYHLEPVLCDLPDDFDAESFIANSKESFINLQKAWDKLDLKYINNFVTSEMYGIISKEFEQLDKENLSETQIVNLNVRIVDFTDLEDSLNISVQFTGSMKDSLDHKETNFSEIWNLVKYKNQAQGWLLAGVQPLEDTQ